MSRFVFSVVFAAQAAAFAGQRTADDELFVSPIAPERRIPNFLKITPGGEKPPAAAGAKIEWQRWSVEAFGTAAQQDKLIFVFVTAPWSQRGAQMEATTFRDPEVIAQLTRNVIPIRLERDERPDVDLRLQEAVQALAGVRGWPLCVFLTASGGVIYGGTHFSAADDASTGEAGLRSTLRYLLRTYHEQRELPLKQAAAVEPELAKHFTPGPAEISPARLDAYAAALQSQVDARAGGFNTGGAAKFPAPRALDFLLMRYARTGNGQCLSSALLTVEQMIRGGIYDQLGGGFHRHTLDRWWRVPLFEKFLISNAEITHAALQTWQATESPVIRQAIIETLEFWHGQRTPEGLFFCNSVAGDATHYGWTRRELEQLFSDDIDVNVAAALFHILDEGELVTTAPNRNTLFRAQADHDIADELKIRLADVRQRAVCIVKILQQAREQRSAPLRDPRAYTAGNALMAAAFIDCGRALGLPRYTEEGLRVARGLLVDALGKNGARHELRNDKGSSGLALDEAALASLCVTAYEHSNDAQFLTQAAAAFDRLEKHFWDKDKGGLFDRRTGDLAEPAGTWKRKVYADTFEPSANAVAAQTALRLNVLTTDDKYLKFAEAIAKSAGQLERMGPFAAGLACATDGLLAGSTEILVVGKANDPAVVALLDTACAIYAPHKIVRRVDEHAEAKNGALIITKDKRQTVNTPQELRRALTLRAR